jgi:hypothetical protein
METVRSMVVPGLILSLFLVLAGGTLMGFGDLGGAFAQADAAEHAREAEIAAARMRTAMKGAGNTSASPANSCKIQ